MPTSRLSPDQLADYFTGALSETERAEIERAAAGNPQLAVELDGLRRKWEHGRALAAGQPDVERGWDAVARQIGVDVRNEHVSRPAQRIRRRSFSIIRLPGTLPQIITAGVLAIALVFLGWTSGRDRIRNDLASRVSTYTTENGQRSTVSLPDGSVVVLNVGSQLEIPTDYATGNRAVRLTGEALFTVVSNAHSPFTVTAGGRTVRVLGTSFAVRHYPTDTATMVAVRDGKVAVRTTVLAAMQQAQFGGNIAPPQVHAANPGQFSFATGVLSLNGLPIAEAIIALNRWYDADIRLGDTTLRYERISGRFTAGSLADLAENLEWTFNLRVIRSGRVLTLYPRGKNDGAAAELK